MSNTVLETIHTWGVDYTMDGLVELEIEIRDLRNVMMEYNPVPHDIVLQLTGSLALIKAAKEFIKIGERMKKK